MKIRLEAFALAREKLGWKERAIELENDADLAILAARLAAEHPAAAEALRSCRFAVNDAYAAATALLKDDDLVSIIPPVSGGAPAAAVSPAAIDLREAEAAVRAPRSGAIALFVGTVRDRHEDQAVVAIEYEAKVEMAIMELDRLAGEARRRFAIDAVFIRHRIGRVAAGEAAVVIAVAAERRDPAYAANAWLLAELKRTVPIWKHEERLVDGRVERVWLGQGGG